MKKQCRKHSDLRPAFSLAELLAALVVASMIIAATSTIYYVSRKAFFSIERQVEQLSLPRELLQKIAEDVHSSITGDADSKVVVLNRPTGDGFESFLQMENVIYDRDKKKRVFKKVEWLTRFDSETSRYTLYRSYSGMVPEDEVIGTEHRQDPDLEIYVPVTDRLTYCKFEILGEKTVEEQEVINLESWNSTKLPGALVVSLSFAEPQEVVAGEFEVLENDIVRRTIAVNRDMQYKFQFVRKDLKETYGPLPGEEDEEMDAQENIESVKDDELTEEDRATEEKDEGE